MCLKENFKKQCMKQIWNFHKGGEGRGGEGRGEV